MKLHTIALAITLLSSAAMASGFKCSSDHKKWTLQIYNHTDGATSVPATFILSKWNKKVLDAFNRGSDEEIQKEILTNGTKYVVRGNRKVDADTVTLHLLTFREGVDRIEEGDSVEARLYFDTETAEGTERKTVSLECKRYLKSE